MPRFVAGALLLSLVGCTSNAADIGIPKERVVRLEIDPYPEGPPSIPFVRGDSHADTLPISRVERWIPSPLPAPLDQGSCEFGGNLLVELTDGTVVTYGPCHRPPSIDRLWTRMVDVMSDGRCRPRCGPS